MGDEKPLNPPAAKTDAMKDMADTDDVTPPVSPLEKAAERTDDDKNPVAPDGGSLTKSLSILQWPNKGGKSEVCPDGSSKRPESSPPVSPILSKRLRENSENSSPKPATPGGGDDEEPAFFSQQY